MEVYAGEIIAMPILESTFENGYIHISHVLLKKYI